MEVILFEWQVWLEHWTELVNSARQVINKYSWGLTGHSSGLGRNYVWCNFIKQVIGQRGPWLKVYKSLYQISWTSNGFLIVPTYFTNW